MRALHGLRVVAGGQVLADQGSCGGIGPGRACEARRTRKSCPLAGSGARLNTEASQYRWGMTLVELVLAIGLFSILMIAVFQLLDRSLSLWRRGETRRVLLEQSSAVLEMLAADLRGLENGRAGDLVFEWVRFDTDRDGIAESLWPRLRVVRQGSAADVERLRAARRASEEPKAPSQDAAPERAAPGLIEVVWLWTPASLVDADGRAEGIAWRGERLYGESSSKSFFASDFFGTSNRPPAGAVEEVCGGILWAQPLLATQTSVVHSGWKLSSGLDSPASSWDAWSSARPDAQVHAWNEPAPGMPRAGERPLLPRRVRIELEVERAADRLRRTRLVAAVESGETALQVDDLERIPREAGAYVKIDAEWMRIEGADQAGGSASREVRVARAQRGTAAASHPSGALVHWGLRLAREVPVTTYREDWNL
jgi:type II secretory pathway pseudopilin PulG